MREPGRKVNRLKDFLLCHGDLRPRNHRHHPVGCCSKTPLSCRDALEHQLLQDRSHSR